MVLNQERGKSLIVLIRRGEELDGSNQERSKSLVVLIRREEELDGSK
jgi:hypothetical protein